MVAPLRFGIVGLGWVARDYMLPALAAAGERVRLTAVVDPRPLDRLPDDVYHYSTLDQLLAHDRVDAVYVATPNHLHEPQAIACLAAGLHVLCEKPLARTPDAVERMRGAALAGDRLLVTAYDQRHHPAHRAMRRLIRQGRLGTLTQCRIDYACWVDAGWSEDNWRVDPDRAGGGAVIDLAPHGLDLLEWLTGDAIVDVHCFLQTAVQNYPVDDGGVLTARFTGGGLAGLNVAYNRPETLPRRRLEVIGTKGMLLAENTMGQTPGGTLYFIDAADGRRQPIVFPTHEGPFHHQLTHFLDRIYHAPADNRDLDATLRHVRLLAAALDRAAPPQPTLSCP